MSVRRLPLDVGHDFWQENVLRLSTEFVPFLRLLGVFQLFGNSDWIRRDRFDGISIMGRLLDGIFAKWTRLQDRISVRRCSRRSLKCSQGAHREIARRSQGAQIDEELEWVETFEKIARRSQGAQDLQGAHYNLGDSIFDKLVKMAGSPRPNISTASEHSHGIRTGLCWPPVTRRTSRGVPSLIGGLAGSLAPALRGEGEGEGISFELL